MLLMGSVKQSIPPLPNTLEGALNWIAVYSESGSNRVGEPIEQKPHPYASAVEITNAMRHPNSNWAQGLQIDRPYGVGNKSLFPDLRYLDKATDLGMIAWQSGSETGDEVIIPTGCGAYLLSGDKTNYTVNHCGNNGEWPLDNSDK